MRNKIPKQYILPLLFYSISISIIVSSVRLIVYPNVISSVKLPLKSFLEILFHGYIYIEVFSLAEYINNSKGKKKKKKNIWRQHSAPEKESLKSLLH